MNIATWTGLPDPDATPWNSSAPIAVNVPNERVRHVAVHLARAYEN